MAAERRSLSCFEELVARWREAAAELEGPIDRPYSGGSETASVLNAVAAELEDRIQTQPLEELSVPEAAQESGYSEYHLRELVRNATIPAYRNGSRWRIQRRYIPQRPGVPRR